MGLHVITFCQNSTGSSTDGRVRIFRSNRGVKVEIV